MKKLISFISFVLVVIFLMGSVPAFGEGNMEWTEFHKEDTIVRDGFTFDVGGLYACESWEEDEFLYKAAEVVKYTGDDETVTVPGEIDGYKVWCIRGGAFDNVPAKKIILPDNLERLTSWAFENCPNLQTIVFGKAAPTEIEPSWDILPCTRNCPSFKRFVVANDNLIYATIDDGVLIRDSKISGYDYNKMIMDYPEGRPSDSYYLRKEVRYASQHSFAYTSNLKYVSFGYNKMHLSEFIFADSSVAAVMLDAKCVPSGYAFDYSNVKYVFYKGTKEQWKDRLGTFSDHFRSDCVKDKDIKVIYNAKDVEKVFTDVSTSAWYRGATEFAYNAGLMDGVAKDRFGPGDPETRAMLVATLWRLEGKPKAKTKAPFTDLKQDWYIPAVNWAYEKGIVDGLTKTKFSPGGTLTREQLATIMYRYAEYKKLDTKARADLSGYKDASKIHSYAKDAVSWAVASGLIKGTAPKKLSPLGITTRAQVATILLRQA